MMAGLNNLWRGHYTNHQLSFQRIMDLGVGPGAGRAMGHLALDQSLESKSNVSYKYGLTENPNTGPSTKQCSFTHWLQSWLCQSQASNPHEYVFFLSGRGRSRKGLKNERQLGKCECHLEINTAK